MTFIIERNDLFLHSPWTSAHKARVSTGVSCLFGLFGLFGRARCNRSTHLISLARLSYGEQTITNRHETVTTDARTASTTEKREEYLEDHHIVL